jgi:hypothetical protein
MADNPVLSELVGNDLAGFQVVKMTEAFDVNDDGRRTKSIGYFKDHDTAKAFIGPRATNSHKRVKDVFVLTDGKVGLVIDTNEVVNLIDDEAALLEIKEKAVAKLTPEERKVLGLE